MTTPANGALSLPGATLRFQVAGSGPAVVLVHGFGLDMRDAESEAGLAELSRQVAAGGVATGRTAWLAHPLFAVARRDRVLAEQLAAMVADYPGQHWLGIDPHLPDDLPLIQALEQITAPALVVAGQHDVPGFLAMSDVLARRLPAAEHVLIPDAGHMVSMEQPGLVNAAIGGFLRRQAPRQNAEIT